MGNKLAEQLETHANNPTLNTTQTRQLLKEAAQTIQTLEDSNMDLATTIRQILIGDPT
jgi:hypothetical protein